MRIRKLRASFGNLQGRTLTLHGGLNVLYAPNESGKSTWCAFIRAMLYGIDAAEQPRDGYLPDRQRFAPWSGDPMEGSMQVVADGFDITIERRTLSGNAPMKDFTAVYTESGMPVEGMTEKNCGELLTGVSREVFRRTAFIEQGSMAVSNSPELERRIQSIVSSGEEKISCADAEAKLLEWKKKRRDQQRGILPAKEKKIADTERLLSEMDHSVDNVHELEHRLEAAQEECTTLEAAVLDARKQQRAEALSRLRAGRTDVQNAGIRHDEALAELSRRRNDLAASDFSELTADELKQEIDRDRESLFAAKELPSKGRSVLPAIVFSFLAVTLAAMYGVTVSLPLIILAALCCLMAVFFFIRYSRIHQDSQQLNLEQQQLLRKYRISIPEELDSVLERRLALEAAVQRAEAEEQACRLRMEQATLALHQLEEQAIDALDFTGGNSEAARLTRSLQVKRQELAQLGAQLSGVKGRLSAMGDPMVLSSAVETMREDLLDIQGEYDAITMAYEALRDASLDLQRRFSPELSSLAASYMAEMTGGRYKDVLVGQDFSARARTEADDTARDAEYLSAGTLDLLYLAVRLAVCELALPAGEPCPLILDDVLVNLDETRMEQALNLLKKLALKRQIVLFSCREVKLDPEESA